MKNPFDSFVAALLAPDIDGVPPFSIKSFYYQGFSRVSPVEII